MYAPEAAVGGPIALVEEGDIIEINIPANTLELCVFLTRRWQEERQHGHQESQR